jgi:hypothetical protein
MLSVARTTARRISKTVCGRPSGACSGGFIVIAFLKGPGNHLIVEGIKRKFFRREGEANPVAVGFLMAY